MGSSGNNDMTRTIFNTVCSWAKTCQCTEGHRKDSDRHTEHNNALTDGHDYIDSKEDSELQRFIRQFRADQTDNIRSIQKTIMNYSDSYDDFERIGVV